MHFLMKWFSVLQPAMGKGVALTTNWGAANTIRRACNSFHFKLRSRWKTTD